MSGQTVDYGIDLGTTNSAVARMTRKGPEILRSRTQSPVTPSAVAINRQGQTVVGEDALRDLEIPATRNFKRAMGSPVEFSLRGGSRWSPERLSAEVLKDLKATVRRRYDEDLCQVVVTVPAMFQQPQCEATRRAAELAGLEAVVLLQEPIAAATAYLSDRPDPGPYLVYDLGGGTFDVSVVRLHRGEMTVLSHGGDNFLGGSDFDRAVVNWLEAQLDGRGVAPDVLKASRSRWILEREAERARLLLTDQEDTVVDLTDLQLPVSRLLLTRDILEALCEPLVQRTLWLAEERLRETGIAARDLKGVLLVGGPTQMPMIRRCLKGLGAPLRTDQDPMTVVACGAAIHSSTILRSDRARGGQPASPRSAVLELHYDPVVQEQKSAVSGRLLQPAGFQGEVRLSRAAGDWQSGWIGLRKGAFFCEVLLSDDEVTEFQVELRDESGAAVAVQPAGFSMRLGVAAARPVTPYDYGVALVTGEFQPIVGRGLTLPAQGSETVKSTRAIPARSSEELVIHFLEGNSPLALDNTAVGELRIAGTELPRPLPEDSEIQISMIMDESRLIRARVYIPLLDLSFSPEFHLEIASVDTRTLVESLAQTRDLMDDVQPHAGSEEQHSLLQAAREMEQLEAELAERPRDPIARHRVQKKLADVRTQLRPLARKHETEVLLGQVRKLVDETRALCQRLGEPATLVNLDALEEDAWRHNRALDRKGLERVLERVRSLRRPLLYRTPEFWREYLDYLASCIDESKDRVRFHECLRKAEAWLEQGDLKGCHACCLEALNLLPEVVSSKARFADATIRAVLD